MDFQSQISILSNRLEEITLRTFLFRKMYDMLLDGHAESVTFTLHNRTGHTVTVEGMRFTHSNFNKGAMSFVNNCRAACEMERTKVLLELEAVQRQLDAAGV